jgi:hypothetical protein
LLLTWIRRGIASVSAEQIDYRAQQVEELIERSEGKRRLA